MALSCIFKASCDRVSPSHGLNLSWLFYCISLTDPSYTFKGSCDYTGSIQIIQDNHPILKHIILIPSAKSHLPCNITSLGLTPVSKDHVVQNRVNAFCIPSLLYTDWFHWAFTYYIHLLCDLGLATFLFMQNFQSERPEHPEPPSKAARDSQGHTHVCLRNFFFHIPYWHLVLSHLSPAVTNKVL